MKISTEQLKEIIESHGKWWRDEEGGQRADLQGAYLRGADLRGADLQGAYLQGADLQGAYLRGADLQGADLQGAYLQRADLRGADLRGADLQGAYLQRADLRGADLPDGIYQIVGCGSVNRCTTYDSINDCVICGCWNDNNGNHLEAFEQRIENIYGENGIEPNEKYYAEYKAAVIFFKTVKG